MCDSYYKLRGEWFGSGSWPMDLGLDVKLGKRHQTLPFHSSCCVVWFGLDRRHPILASQLEYLASMILITSLTPLLLLIPSTLALALDPAPHGTLIPGGSGFRECYRLFAHDPPPPPTHIQSLDAYIPISLGEPTMMK